MTENKRFTTNGYKIYDNYHDGVEWLVNNVEAEEIVEIMNILDIKARERGKALSKLQKILGELKYKYDEKCNEYMGLEEQVDSLLKENEELKETKKI